MIMYFNEILTKNTENLPEEFRNVQLKNEKHQNSKDNKEG